jgi:hypothetical protein
LRPCSEWSNLPAHLISEVRRGHCVAFVGAGFSMPAGFPSWDGLLRKMLEAAIGGGEAIAVGGRALQSDQVLI